jgi:hypothetical protein
MVLSLGIEIADALDGAHSEGSSVATSSQISPLLDS